MNQSSSFGLYESMRILVPGFYFATLLFFFYWSFATRYVPELFHGLPALVLFVFTMLVSGLTMYAKESTKRRKAFQENQPSVHLLTMARTAAKVAPLDENDAQRLYFYLLNNVVPAIFHEKIFFFGTIYHIMILVRRTSFWFGIAALVALGIQLSTGLPLSDQQSLVVFAAAVWVIYALNVRYNKADRRMQENYRDQIFWLEMNRDVVEQTLRKRRP